MTTRYALYAMPPAGHPLTGFAARWLGRDPETQAHYGVEPAGSVPAHRIAELTSEPRRYGFHATLKPPFGLAAGCDERELTAAVAAFARTRPVFTLPALAVRPIGRFLALCPEEPCLEAERLAAACVRDFDRFRAPQTADELTRRRQAGLTPRQDQYLVTWGYPYVLEEFRLHFTLTGPVDDAAERMALQAHLAAAIDGLNKGRIPVEDICLFQQAGADEPFVVTARYPLGGAGS